MCAPVVRVSLRAIGFGFRTPGRLCVLVCDFWCGVRILGCDGDRE